VFGVDYRYVQADYIDRTLRFGDFAIPLRMLVPCIVALIMLAGLQIFLTKTFIGRAIMAVSQDQLALQLMAADPIRIKRIAFAISIATASIAGALLIVIQPVEPSVGREYIGRVFAICVLGGLGSLPGTLIGAMLLGIIESLTATFYGPSWAPAVAFGFLLLTLAVRPAGDHGAVTMRNSLFIALAVIAAGAVYALARIVNNDYLFFAGYVVLQFVVLATAWNILGGYCGYVNFGSAAFFALGAYTTVAMVKFPALATKYFPEWLAALVAAVFPLPIPVLILLGGIIAGLVGLGTGYLTLRLRGVYFSIATLALAVVLQTLVVNWDYVGGSRGAYVVRPAATPLLGINYIEYLFLLMLALSVAAIAAARAIEHSRLGFGFASIRDDEIAAESCGVPTLRLKLIATTLSGAFMGMAGAPFPYYIGYLEPSSAFGLAYAVNSIAMPMIGGTTSWVGPLIGAVLLGTLQQLATVTISSAVSLLIVGLLLVGFVIVAPNGIVGLFETLMRRERPEPSQPLDAGGKA
jgi:branched-chain amino acid transport system permease protein